MNMKFYLPTHIFFEKDCVAKHGEVFASLGKKAILVTGRHSAQACGALEDVTEVLRSQGIRYEVCNQVENNPSLETVVEIAGKAREFGAEMVIGIGGGSPLDASKAVSILAANPQMDPLELFGNQFTRKLPLIAIPTTAGTGSEATCYSVLLRRDLETKVSFGNDLTYPDYAMTDYKYTMDLSLATTRSTCIDAFTHVFEGYLAKRSTALSDALALLGIRLFGDCIRDLVTGEITEAGRENMSLLSLLGGMVIAQAGVTSPHGMGYCYTYFKGIPHGMANGLLFREYLHWNTSPTSAAADKINRAMAEMGFPDVEAFLRKWEQILVEYPPLTEEEVEKYTRQSMLQKGSLANSPTEMTEEVVRQLWDKQRELAGA